ncbi:invasion associated locus B family protein [Roseobacter sinensis]|uniref:Invasion associated locus B family protein n=1 Tax=Roseobacter sinensis TaxID=2931391 RepID=A0ABT3B8P8_9RHOB|nr:invasion associated locus B family protein [Roseobacter sp. WL0113]MCV3269944.1 invasion associated locus B family protein [Roseobacter sp. WL0113]
MRIFNGFAGLVSALALAAASAQAQDQSSSNLVAEKTDWGVYEDTDPKECWGVSVPKEVVNTRDGRVVAANRGQILLMVFYRPGADANGVVTFTGGYPFADGSKVNLEIGGTNFSLFTSGEWAWSENAQEDTKIVEAMKRGANAVVTGLSSRGTTTQDTFSLLGFTAALEEAQKRCAS